MISFLGRAFFATECRDANCRTSWRGAAVPHPRQRSCRLRGPDHQEPLSYHDLYITTARIPRARIFDLPYGLDVRCNRVAGWELWDTSKGFNDAVLLAGEYARPDEWLVLDVAGHVILDSRLREEEPA